MLPVRCLFLQHLKLLKNNQMFFFLLKNPLRTEYVTPRAPTEFIFSFENCLYLKKSGLWATAGLVIFHNTLLIMYREIVLHGGSPNTSPSDCHFCGTWVQSLGVLSTDAHRVTSTPQLELTETAWGCGELGTEGNGGMERARNLEWLLGNPRTPYKNF